MRKPLRLLFEICLSAAKRFLEDGYTYKAAALAYTTLLALVPLLFVVVFFITIFPIFADFINFAQNFIFTNFIPTFSTNIENYLNIFVEKANQLPAISMVFLFFTAGTTIVTIIHTFNQIWNCPKKNHKMDVVYYWIILILAPVVMILSLILSSYLFSLYSFQKTFNQLGIGLYFFAAFSFLIDTIIFSMLYIIVPNCKVYWQDALVGGLIASLLFEIAKKAFAFYILKFPSYELIYGVLAIIPIFVFWLYISWVVILYGALITHKFSLLRERAYKL